MFDSVNHTHLPKEVLLLDWACRDNHSTEGERVEGEVFLECVWRYKRQEHIVAALPLIKELPLCIELEAGWAPEPLWTILRREISCHYYKSNHSSFGVHPVA
jgi:hypothetical protein